jgi:hypothetical protein
LEVATAVRVVDRDGQPPEDGPPASFQEMMLRLSNQAVSLCISKQKDYGPKNISAFGLVGVLVRMNDKFERLKNLTKTGKRPTNETIEDSLIDVANYAMIALAVHRGWWTDEHCPPLLEERG